MGPKMDQKMKPAMKQKMKLEMKPEILPGALTETSHNPDQITEDRYYTDSYYMGTEFYIEEPDDMLLETVPVSGDGYFYGFMLMDVRQNIYYTDFTGIETEDTGS